jgi:hypothetical protein
MTTTWAPATVPKKGANLAHGPDLTSAHGRDVSPDTIIALLRELRAGQLMLNAKVDALRADLARRRVPPDDGPLLLAIATATAGRVFSSKELRAHARADADLAQALGRLSSRQIGKRLRALAGRDVGGFVVRRVGRDGDGTIWTVQVAHLHTGAGAVADDGA